MALDESDAHVDACSHVGWWRSHVCDSAAARACLVARRGVRDACLIGWSCCRADGAASAGDAGADRGAVALACRASCATA